MRNLGNEARLRRWGINGLEDRRVRGENDPVNLSTERVLTNGCPILKFAFLKLKFFIVIRISFLQKFV